MTLYCADLDSTAMIMVIGDNDPGTTPLEIAKSLRCPTPDAAEPTDATIDAVFAPVCESGTLTACQFLIQYIEAGNATGEVMSPAHWAIATTAPKFGLPEGDCGVGSFDADGWRVRARE